MNTQDLLSELKEILEKEKKIVIKESLEKEFIKADILGITENLITLSIPPGIKFEVGDSIGFKDWEIVNENIEATLKLLGVVIDVDDENNHILVYPFESVTSRLEDREEIEIIEAESLIGINLQLDLISNIENAKKNGIQLHPAIRFFMEKIETMPLKEEVKIIDIRDISGKIQLDDSQIKAVNYALSLNDGEILLIIGPPGCGKTNVISKIAYELSNKGYKILIASHTNIAVDNAIEKLPLEKTLRVGRVEKITENVKKYMLSFKAKEVAGEELKKMEDEISRIKKELQPKLKKIKEIRARIYGTRDITREQHLLIKEWIRLGIPEWEVKKRMREMEKEWRKKKEEKFKKEVGNLLEEVKKLERELSELYSERKKLLESNMEKTTKISQIIGSTLIKSQLPPLDEVNDFDYVIIDEASQATITLALLGMIKGKKWILVGDDKQLLPIFKSIKSIEKCKKFSAFSHLVEKYPNRVTWLRIHYRSNEKIINFSAKEVYNGNIKPHESCKNKKLPIENWYKEEKYKILDPNIPVIFVHVNGNEEKIDNSKVNKEEINTVFEIIRMLKECKVDMDKVGIITPFREQAKRIREKVENASKEVEVSTVDAFQGREKDVIIFSVTSTKSFRFVSDENRLNVALTRPKYKLIVIGNAIRIKDANNKLLIKRFLRYVDELKSVFDFNEKKFISLNLST